MILPRPLPDGGHIRVVSVSGPVRSSIFESSVGLLQGKGYEVTFNPRVLRGPHPYLAAGDEERLKDLIDAFDDPEVDAVICARGGYGALRILPHVDGRRLAEMRKPFVGFSDITTLHLALNQWGLVTFHGPMMSTLASGSDPDGTLDRLIDHLAGRIGVSQSLQGRPGQKGSARAPLVGGNLSLLAACLPTRLVRLHQPCILLVEEVDEPLYRIDRMLTGLRLGGYLDGVIGFVLGSFTRCGAEDGSESLSPTEVALDCLAPCASPVITDIPLGHGDDDGIVPLGVEAEVDGRTGTLTWFWPRVDS